MTPELSVIIPVRDESANVATLHAELIETLGAWGRPYEIIVIDDGSTDDTFDILVA